MIHQHALSFMCQVLTNRRMISSALLLILSLTASANGGGVDYSQGAGALATAVTFAVNLIGYTVAIVYSLASLFSLVSALQIFVKMNTGEVNFTKEIIRLVGAVLILIGSTVVLPAFFGFDYANNFVSPW